MKVTVVTPSLNQVRFVERTVESVLSQEGDFELEYLVVDGGSTDGTLAVLDRYSGRLTCVSEPDEGQSDALNKGFSRASGDVLAWLNSDDVYVPGALERVRVALETTGAAWCFGQCRVVDEDDREIRRPVTRYKNHASRRYSFRGLLARNFVSQPAVFFRRDLLARVGPLRRDFHLAMDYELWLRFARIAEPVFVPHDLAAFRWHASSKSGSRWGRMAWEAFQAAALHARPEEHLSVARHYVHFLRLRAVYGALGLLERGPGHR